MPVASPDTLVTLDAAMMLLFQSARSHYDLNLERHLHLSVGASDAERAASLERLADAGLIEPTRDVGIIWTITENGEDVRDRIGEASRSVGADYQREYLAVVHDIQPISPKEHPDVTDRRVEAHARGAAYRHILAGAGLAYAP